MPLPQKKLLTGEICMSTKPSEIHGIHSDESENTSSNHTDNPSLKDIVGNGLSRRNILKGRSARQPSATWHRLRLSLPALATAAMARCWILRR